jgi:hypothetical protein
MRILKKYYIVLLASFALISCSSDNDDNTSTQDPIIGAWYYIAQFENDADTTVNDCEPSVLEFTANGNRTDIYFSDNSGDCVVVDTVNMTWERLSDGTYEFTQNGFTFSETVIFENDNTTLNLESSDTDGNGNVVTYRFVYNKVLPI